MAGGESFRITLARPNGIAGIPSFKTRKRQFKTTSNHKSIHG
jgi:hypothetical protein